MRREHASNAVTSSESLQASRSSAAVSGANRPGSSTHAATPMKKDRDGMTALRVDGHRLGRACVIQLYVLLQREAPPVRGEGAPVSERFTEHGQAMHELHQLALAR